jgi:histidinol-phosphate/aromatic aminotransferase/cobyric acid decarboxylase-like protein
MQEKRMLSLTKSEKSIANSIEYLKSQSGSHSPSVLTLLAQIPTVKMKIDACFLSNPYATQLFLKYLERDLLRTNKIKDIIEFYPSQNHFIAKILAQTLKIAPGKIFVGNGASEVIQAIIHSFTHHKIMIALPTFSPYYEFAEPGVDVVFTTLDRNCNFQLDIDRYIDRVKRERPDTIVLINPNNPTGGYINRADIKHIVEELPDVDNIIIDESFIHFAFEDDTYRLESAAELADTFENLIVIKSMSKDFGIAGIRAGYALMSEDKVDRLLKNGYLWNVSGLAQYFFTLYAQPTFLQEYELVRIRYIKEAQNFFHQLSEFPSIKIYPSMANFALIELIDGSTATNFTIKMLANQGIYTRNCGDKVGLSGEFIRIAARTKVENQSIVQAISHLFPQPDFLSSAALSSSSCGERS